MVVVSPASASLDAGGSATFSCAVSGSSDGACTYAVAEPSGGSVTADGVYTAPQSAGIYHVVATSHADPTRTATATVTVVSTGAPTPTPTYFVDATAGSDAAAGTSAATAWRSLARVNAATLRPGDVVGFKRGETFPGTLIVRQSGTASAPIQLVAYGTGAMPVLDAGASEWAIQVAAGIGYVVIDGLVVRNAGNIGILLADGAHHNVVRNCEITNVGTGISSAGAYNVITRNNIHDLHMVRNDATPDNDFGAMAVNLSFASNVEVSHNRMVNCRAPSIDYGHDGGAVELWRSSSDVSIHHNYVQNCDGFLEAGGEAGDSVSRITVAYNVVVDMYSNFSCIHLGGGFAIGASDLRFENNTVVGAADSDAYMIWFDVNPTAGMASFRNNILVLSPRMGLVSYGNSGFAHDHNLVWRTSGSAGTLGMTLGSAETFADPQFVDLVGRNLHLQAGSPARGAGTGLGWTEDIDGNPVPASSPSLGAYE